MSFGATVDVLHPRASAGKAPAAGTGAPNPRLSNGEPHDYKADPGPDRIVEILYD